METECEYIHSKGKLSALSDGVSGKVVQRIARELFDLKARGDIFLITLYKLNNAPNVCFVVQCSGEEHYKNICR